VVLLQGKKPPQIASVKTAMVSLATKNLDENLPSLLVLLRDVGPVPHSQQPLHDQSGVKLQGQFSIMPTVPTKCPLMFQPFPQQKRL
jgi:hypothetical protein